MSQLSDWKRAHMCTENHVCFGRVHVHVYHVWYVHAIHLVVTYHYKYVHVHVYHFPIRKL